MSFVSSPIFVSFLFFFLLLFLGCSSFASTLGNHLIGVSHPPSPYTCTSRTQTHGLCDTHFRRLFVHFIADAPFVLPPPDQFSLPPPKNIHLILLTLLLVGPRRAVKPFYNVSQITIRVKYTQAIKTESFLLSKMITRWSKQQYAVRHLPFVLAYSFFPSAPHRLLFPIRRYTFDMKISC